MACAIGALAETRHFISPRVFATVMARTGRLRSVLPELRAASTPSLPELRATSCPNGGDVPCRLRPGRQPVATPVLTVISPTPSPHDLNHTSDEVVPRNG